MGAANTPRLIGSTRFAYSFVGFVGCILIYMLRNDLSFAVVCMVNSTAVDDHNQRHSSCGGGNDTDSKNNDVEGKLVWSKSLQGYVLSAFFWGYIFSQILGGYLAGRCGGKIVIGTAVFISSALTLVSPALANTNVYLFLALRALMGFTQGTIFPAWHAMWASWAPPLERSFLTGFNYAGVQIGNTVAMPLSGVLCKYGFAGGWPSIYYIFGALGVLWCLLWFFYVTDTPSKHRFISERERKYIESSLQETMSSDEHPTVPWTTILKSVPVWGLWGGHFASDWGAYMMMTSLPLFLNDVLGLDLTSMGGVSAIPYVVYFCCINVGGLIADKIRNLQLFSTITTRRTAMIISMGSEAAFLLGCGYCGCGQETLVIVFVSLGIGLSGFAYAGFVVNYLDIAPAFAGPVLGIGNTITCVGGIMAPLVVGWLTPNGTRGEWLVVFWITAGILAVGSTIFCVFASGEVQPWAIPRHADSGSDQDSSSVEKAWPDEKPSFTSLSSFISSSSQAISVEKC